MKFATDIRLTAQQIKSFRKENKLTQKDLSQLLNVSVKTIEKWEREENKISGTAALAIMLFSENPKMITELQIPEKKYKYRFYYMWKAQINTIIDVDYVNRIVEFKNFTNNINRKAFGKYNTATFDMFEEFLKSRCFPETRENLKIQLRELNIPFYDPLLIIEKTEGRMAEDDFWIKIER